MNSIQKIKNYLPLILIVIVALFLRLYQIDKVVWKQAGFDESRDMLVASHIVNNNEHVSKGPLAAGGMNVLKNSPVYYYFVAFILFFTKKPTTFMYGWAVIMTIPVFVGYFTGKTLKDNLTGLILAGLLTINNRMVFGSRELLQPHLLLLFSIIYIWASISFLKNKKHKPRNFLLSITFLLIPLHFHYGILIILPAGIAWTVYFWFQINKNTHKLSIYNLFTPFTLALTLILSWLVLTYKLVIFDQFYFLLFNFDAKYKLSFLLQIKEVYSTTSQMIWGNYHPELLTAIFLTIGLILKKRIMLYKKSILFLFSASSSILFFGFYKHFVAETYISAIFPFFIVLISIILRELINKNKTLGWTVTIACFLIMYNSTKQQILSNLPNVSYETQQKEISKLIFNNYQNLKINNKNLPQPKLLLSLYTTTKQLPFDGWGTSGFWYYLENYFNKNLVKNTNYGVNHTPIEKFPSVLYMICDHRIYPELIQQECVDRFKKSYPIINNEITEVSKKENFSVWSARVKSEIQTKNVVNYEITND